jgi:glycosyltransferase involved in cell wall biosynthesis
VHLKSDVLFEIPFSMGGVQNEFATSAGSDPSAEPCRVLFLFWGRRGALSRFMLELTQTVRGMANIEATISLSRQNELFDQFMKFDVGFLPVDTFTHALGAFTNVGRLLRLRRTLRDEIVKRRIDTVITLMPHVWSPVVSSMVRSLGRRYTVVLHNASRHSGDRSGWVNAWLLSDAINADVVITLSEAVAGQLSATGQLSWRKLYTLSHPEFCYGKPIRPSHPTVNGVFRLAFFGRILEYKGLPMLVDAIEMLREEGLQLQLGVFGEGDLSIVLQRLRSLNAEIVNGWIPDGDVGAILARHHAVVLAHTEASQSGVVAAAHGLGLPVIITPVGGLTEQVRDGETGIIAAHVDAPSLAAAIKRIALSPGLYNHICDGIANTRDQRSMTRFVADLISHARFTSS